MVPWWMLLVTLALGALLGVATVAIWFWVGGYREWREHDADIRDRNAVLQARGARGCRRTDGRI